VHWLSVDFIKEVEGYGKDASLAIEELEDLTKPNGFIRQKGDGPYIDRNSAIEKKHIGPSNLALVTSWKNTLRDIVDTLVGHCKDHDLDPEQTFVWVDFLCNNLHAAAEDKTLDDNMLQRMARNKESGVEIVVVISPWNKPLCLTQVWNMFELYKANENDCKIHFAMPPEEKTNMLRTAVFNEEGFGKILDAVRAINLEKAETSDIIDKDQILKIIDEDPGFYEVNEWLKDWVKDKVVDELFSQQCQEIASADDIDRLCNGLGNIMHSEKNFQQAYSLFQKSLEIREKIERDSRDLMIASAWTNIGLVLEDMEDPEESLLYLKKALLLRERKLGRNSIPTSDSHTYIGNVQMLQGDFPSAHDSYKIALAIEETLHGTSHKRTADCYHNIGKVFEATDKAEDAITYFQQALAIREEHDCLIDTAISYTSIAQSLSKRSEHREALKHYRKAMEIHNSMGVREELALAYNNIAMGYCDAHAYAEALEYLERAIETYELILGKDHPHTKVAKESKKEIHDLQDQELTV